jgi:hypothetical protein
VDSTKHSHNIGGIAIFSKGKDKDAATPNHAVAVCSI